MRDTVTVLHRTWYYMIHGPLLLHVLVQRRHVTRIMATHLCFTSTRMSTALHGYCRSPYQIFDTDHCYYMYMLHRYYDTSHSYVVFMSHRYIYKCTTSRISLWNIELSSLHEFSAYHCYTCMYGFFILVIWIPAQITCIIVPCYRIHVIWLFPVTDIVIPVTRYMSCWYAMCGIPHLLFPFPVILFPLYCSRFPLYCSMLSTELRSSYHVTRIMYCIYSLYTWHIRS